LDFLFFLEQFLYVDSISNVILDQFDLIPEDYLLILDLLCDQLALFLVFDEGLYFFFDFPGLNSLYTEIFRRRAVGFVGFLSFRVSNVFTLLSVCKKIEDDSVV
jgi:hypothetical protein